MKREIQKSYKEGPIQGILDFDTGNQDGFENWRREQEARLDAIRREWGLPVGLRVRIRLRNIDGDFEGTLRLSEPPSRIDRRAPLRLKIDNITFSFVEIEKCVVID